MNYKINLGAWGSIFAVPCSVVDIHIKLAGAAQLKALLYLLRHNDREISTEDIASALGLSNGDACDALQYWIYAGLLKQSENELEPIEENIGQISDNHSNIETKTDKIASEKDIISLKDDNIKIETTEDKKTHKRIAVPASKPTSQEVNQRATESEEIAFLLQEAQLRMGRMISPNESSTLVYLHDYQGLPAGVILMVMEYAASHNKCNMRYIEKVALQWADEEIDTFEKAEQKLHKLEILETNWGKLLNIMGLDKRTATPSEMKYLTKWMDEWKFSMDIIKLAYYECADNTHKVVFRYINKVLESWHNAGVKTVEDVEQLKKLQEEKKSKSVKSKEKNTKKETSFDLDEYERLTNVNPMIKD